jgi:ABC-type uncharacterized transport system YnjBCD permease subunit
MKKAICLLVMAMSVPVLLLHASWQESLGFNSTLEVLVALAFGLASTIYGAYIFAKSTVENIVQWWIRPRWRR